MDKQNILCNVKKLFIMWKNGSLGGEHMPEDCNPNLEKSSLHNYLYFTLPMALNYQRNSYKLWESANLTYKDAKTKFVFDIDSVLRCKTEEVKNALTKYKIVLQSNKQTNIWLTLCKTINTLFDGDIRNLFKICDFDILKIKNYVQIEHKKEFPYLSGNKICNYWLYVLSKYTDIKFVNLCNLTIAPDTHVIQATKKLGLISEEEYNKNNVQVIVIERWNELLNGTELCPIDMHTPLWLWSRNGFIDIK